MIRVTIPGVLCFAYIEVSGSEDSVGDGHSGELGHLDWMGLYVECHDFECK